MGPRLRARACTHLVRRIDSGRGWGIPESGACMIFDPTLRAMAECRHAGSNRLVVGSVRGSPSRFWGAVLLECMVAGKDVCLRRLAKGNRALEVRFNRFLGNDKVTTADIIEGWSEGTAAAAQGRHVLAIQDTSEINFATTPKRR